MSSGHSGCRERGLVPESGGMIRGTGPPLGFPIILLSLCVLLRTGATFAQCEVHEDAKLIASDASGDDHFGGSVSASGDTIVIGARFDDCSAGANCGSAYVYRFNGSTWVEQTKLTASDAAAGDEFGISVSISGDIIVAGAIHDDCAAGIDCGSAYVFRFEGSTWVQQQKLTASDATANHYFGFRVSVSGDLIIVGVFGDECPDGVYCGATYVFRFDGSTWVQEAKLTASDAAQGDLFGASVSVSGNVAVVGAYARDCGAGLDCGSAYVYRFNGSAWLDEGKLTAPDASPGDLFGISVSVSGDAAVVGALYHDCVAGFNCGAAYVYRFNGSTWVEEQKLTASDAASDDRFGNSVSVNGSISVVAAALDDCEGGIDCGSVYVYRFNGSAWVEEVKLTASGAMDAEHFGASVSIGADKAVVGAPGSRCTAGSNCGSAYVHTLGSPPLPFPFDCNGNGIADECDIDSGVSRDADGNGIPDECEVGSCCDGGTGVCADDIPITQCTGPRQTWTVNTPCADLDPACVVPVGACCDHDPFGGCTEGVTRSACSCPRCEWTEDATCDVVACSRESIPTVSGWALAVLSLLLLTGAKLRFGRGWRGAVRLSHN